ncbi:hypothetical protein BJ170DRAFT_641498 [Xylariales sp. AK1849]|nr:hypothetical protein BJ170DRAFT_641498 [Xylariales sp. AK1849]
MLSYVLPALAFATAALAAPLTQDDSCSSSTVCEDFINECGQTYGGCFSACTPWPTFTAPACTPTSTTKQIITSPPIVTSTPLSALTSPLA